MTQWLERHALARELNELEPRELDRLLNENGLDRRNLAELVHGNAQADYRLTSVMERFGVTEMLTERHPDVLRDVQRVCMACPRKRRCRRALRAGASADGFRRFCPNAGTFGALLR